MPQSYIRRGIVVVLTMSGLALLDKAGWGPLGSGEDETHPCFIALVGVVLLVACPSSGACCAVRHGLPMAGTPTVEELERPESPTPTPNVQ